MALGNREISVVLKLVGSQFNQGIGQASQGIGGMISKINVWKVALVGAAGALFALAKGTAESLESSKGSSLPRNKAGHLFPG
jgi:hypothetical protein